MAPSFPEFTGSNIPVHVLLKDVDDDFSRRNITDGAVKIVQLEAKCDLGHCLASHNTTMSQRGDTQTSQNPSGTPPRRASLNFLSAVHPVQSAEQKPLLALILSFYTSSITSVIFKGFTANLPKRICKRTACDSLSHHTARTIYFLFR